MKVQNHRAHERGMTMAMADFNDLPCKQYTDIRDEIRSGDILLCSGNTTFSKLIQKTTDSCWSHVAYIQRQDNGGRVMVLESIECKGVRMIPLSEYISNFEGSGQGYCGRLVVARHAEYEQKATPDCLELMSQCATDRLSRPYSEEEIARIFARIFGGYLGLRKGEIERGQEFICSEYLFECLWILGIDIAYDKRRFIAPADFARDDKVRLMWELETVHGENGMERAERVWAAPVCSPGANVLDRHINFYYL